MGSVFVYAFLVCSLVKTSPVHALDQLVIGHFPHWPTPNQVDKIENDLERELGLEVVWIPFEMGRDINRAMARGDVHIAWAQEFVSFLEAITDGHDFVIAGIALEFPGYDACVVQQGSGIDVDTAHKLKGRSVATIPGSVSHFRLQKTMEHLGVDLSEIKIIPFRDGASVARAFYHDDVAMGCAFGAPLDAMLDRGGVRLLSPQQLQDIGLRTFDVVMMPREFAEVHGDIARKFMQFSDRANQAYRKEPGAMTPTIADAVGMTLEGTELLMGLFDFPTPEEQLSDKWLRSNGLVENYAQELTRFLASHGKLEGAKDDYAPFIYTGLLK